MFERGKSFNRGSRYGGVNSTIHDALFNDIEPQAHLIKERPVHRRIAELAASGHTHQEIAVIVGITPNHVSNIARQPFIRERIVNTIAKNANDEIKQLLEQASKGAVERIIRIAETSQNEKNAMAASVEILDRFLGKPTQTIVNEEKKPVEQMSDDELDRAIAEARGKEASA